MAASESGRSAPTIALDVFRYRPDQEAEPTFQRFDVPYRRDWVVLDALNYVKDQLDGKIYGIALTGLTINLPTEGLVNGYTDI